LGRKATNAEIDRRVDKIHQLLVMCASPSEIKRFAAAEWGLAPRTVDTYIQRARQQLREDCAIDRSDFVAARLLTLDKVVQEAMAAGQHSNVIGALRLALEVTGSMPQKSR
jgi:hypothetical protein